MQLQADTTIKEAQPYSFTQHHQTCCFLLPLHFFHPCTYAGPCLAVRVVLVMKQDVLCLPSPCNELGRPSVIGIFHFMLSLSWILLSLFLPTLAALLAGRGCRTGCCC